MQRPDGIFGIYRPPPGLRPVQCQFFESSTQQKLLITATKFAEFAQGDQFSVLSLAC